MNYFEMVKPTYIENWPNGLLNHSISTAYFSINKEQMKALVSYNSIELESGNKPNSSDLEIISSINYNIECLIEQFPRGAFIRLGSRSPKDSWLGHKEGFCCYDGEKAIKLLIDSERIYDDLQLALSNNYDSYIVVREWIPIEPWQEFRCFYKNRRLMGISQYNYLHQEVFPELIKNKDSIQWAIEIKSDIIKDLLPANDVIVDYVYKFKVHDENIQMNEVVLLECNPFMTYTDPCLFNWSKDKFDNFEFRYFK
jgi:hypothetical protein